MVTKSGENVGQNRLSAMIAGWKGQIAESRSDRLSADTAHEAFRAMALVNEVIAEALVTLVEMQTVPTALPETDRGPRQFAPIPANHFDPENEADGAVH